MKKDFCLIQFPSGTPVVNMLKLLDYNPVIFNCGRISRVLFEHFFQYVIVTVKQVVLLFHNNNTTYLTKI